MSDIVKWADIRPGDTVEMPDGELYGIKSYNVTASRVILENARGQEFPGHPHPDRTVTRLTPEELLARTFGAVEQCVCPACGNTHDSKDL
jgi:signal peptidase I